MYKQPSDKPTDADQHAKAANRMVEWEKFKKTFKKASELKDRPNWPQEVSWAELARTWRRW